MGRVGKVIVLAHGLCALAHDIAFLVVPCSSAPDHFMRLVYG